jgi:hypothetical protein
MTRPANGASVKHTRYDADADQWVGVVVEDPPGTCLGECRDGSISFAVRWNDGHVGSANSRDVGLGHDPAGDPQGQAVMDLGGA